MQTISAYFMSRPGTSRLVRRTWLIKIGDEATQLVRVYPDLGKFVCDCADAKNGNECPHVEAARAADAKRFENQ